MRKQWFLSGQNINEFYFDAGGVWSHVLFEYKRLYFFFLFFFNLIITTNDKRIELLDIIKTPGGGN